MGKILIIVESPAKCKKIESILGKNYICKASFGHIRKLSKVNIKKNFEPIYEVIPEKRKVIQELKKVSSQCEDIIIASDLDREGEAIGFSLIEELGLDVKTTKRIIFNEISKDSITNAVANPQSINVDLYQAQQSRSILDMLLGFGISGVLSKFIKNGLSGGRCQSPALKMLCEREHKIKDFTSEDFYKVSGSFQINEQLIQSSLNKNLDDKEEASDFLKICQQAQFFIGDLKKSESNRNPPSPFITSTLQQEVSNRFGIGPQACMKAAQKLYETGKITYMRTDSVALSTKILTSIEKYIHSYYGKEYSNKKQYKNKNTNTQEAHEAIRPVDVNLSALSNDYDDICQKIYLLIWKRTIASQMTPLKLLINKIVINLNNSKLFFISTINQVLFDGYTKVYKNEDSNQEEQSKLVNIDNLQKKQSLEYHQITSKQDSTNPSGRYSEADLIKDLEKKGIGRPSTFSNIVSTNLARNYVEKRNSPGISKKIEVLKLEKNKISELSELKNIGVFKNKLMVTEIGDIVNEFVSKNFHKTINYTFTADMENQLDQVAAGKLDWKTMLSDFYQIFSPTLEKVKKNEVSRKNDNSLRRVLGQNQDGHDIIVTHAKYGLIVALENKEGTGKDKYQKIAGLPKGVNIEQVTLEQAQKLLAYPLVLGDYQHKKVEVKNGPHGLYATHNSKNYNLSSLKEAEISLEQVIKVIRQQDSNVIRQVNDQISIRKGPYGNYIASLENGKKKNIPFGKSMDPQKITLGEINKMITDYVPKKKWTAKKK